ncbi:MAG: hypothetical protein HYZ26_11200 [Chloroflexi bacterium]|nr:hypothetical protein [Chloroflexota bacterium]
MVPGVLSADLAEIHAIATRAIIDEEFQAAVLNGHRRERLQEFHLSEPVAQKIMAIRAVTLQDFIRHLSVMTGTHGDRFGKR